MVYPTTGLPVTVEIAPGAVLTADPGTWPWVDVTGSWRQRAGITIGEGRGDWGQAVDAGSIGLTFDNLTGDFSQYNPAGRWYGLLGQDTPLRVRLRRGDDTFGRTLAGQLGTADSGQTYTNTGGAAGDYSVVPGSARQSNTTANTSRMSALGVALVDVTVAVTATVPVTASGAVIVAALFARWQDANNYYMAELRLETSNAVTMQLRKVVAGVFTTIVAPTTIPGLTHTAGAAYRLEFRCIDDRLQARAWPDGSAKPAAWHVDATDTAHTGKAGRAGFRSQLAAGNTNTLPVVFSFSAFSAVVDLAGGYVPAWVPRWDKSANDRWVEVTARGALYRLQPGTGKAPKRSPLRRTITGFGPAAYWPVEDGKGAGQVASAIPGHPPLTVAGLVSFRPVADYGSLDNTIHFGTSALADLAGGGQLSAAVPSSTTQATAAQWTVHVAAGLDFGTIAGDVVMLEWTTAGGIYSRWRLVYVKSPTRVRVYGADSAGVDQLLIEHVGVPVGFAQYAVSARQSGGNVVVDLYVNDDASFDSFTGAGTLAGVASFGANTTGTTSTIQMPFGHVAVWAAAAPPVKVGPVADAYGAPTNGAASSYTNEAAHVRLARLGQEDGLSVAMPAVDSRGVARMGPQPVDGPLELYRQCEAVDGGVLFERPHALAYQPRVARYNQAPALTLSAAGDLAEPPEPDPDGQTYRNQITVTRTDGSSATAQTPEVAAGVALVHDDSVELNLSSDLAVPNHAGWRLHLAAYDALRWSSFALNLAASPQLIDAWLNCRIGSRIRATNPPADAAGQDIDVMLEGRTTTLGFKDWDVVATCSPAKPWDVAVVDGPQRVVTSGSTLAADLTAAGASLSLAFTAERWTTDPAAFPLDLRVGGERITVSAITGTTSPQTATVTARGVNGLQRAWAAGTSVDVWEPATVGLTD